MNTQNYAVNIRVGLANPARVNISQGDTGRTLAFSLYDGLSPFTPPTGSTVTIVGRKPSKLGFSETCTVSGNVATVATTLAMTQEAGKFPAELRIEAGGQSIGTANFTMYVEPSPHPDGTTDGTHATVDNLQTQIGNLANLTTTAKSDLVSAINEAAQSGGVVIDDTLTQTGQAADAKKTGDEISTIKADLQDLQEETEGGGSGLTEDAKEALLACFRHIAFLDDDEDYYQNLYDALYPPVPPALLTSISAVYTQSKIIYTDSSLDDLKSDLVVTAYYNNGTSSLVTTYVLGGELTVGTSTITVTYGGKTTTFEVTVTKGIDYTEDALTDVTWNNGYGYSSSGNLVSRSGAYATDKFTVQDLSYKIANLDTTNNTTFYIYVWDENDTFIGFKQASTARFQWKSNYKIAIEARNAGTFDPSTITMLPVDKRETAVDTFEINLASLASSVTKANGYYELNVKTLMDDVGVTSSNYTNALNRQSIIGMIGEAVTTSNFPFKTPIRIGTFNYGSNMLLSIFVEGITVSDANLVTLQNYLVENNIKIRYNY